MWGECDGSSEYIPANCYKCSIDATTATNFCFGTTGSVWVSAQFSPDATDRHKRTRNRFARLRIHLSFAWRDFRPHCAEPNQQDGSGWRGHGESWFDNWLSVDVLFLLDICIGEFAGLGTYLPSWLPDSMQWSDCSVKEFT